MQKSQLPPAWLVALSGMAGLVLAMGVGRFSYTALLPLMQQEAGLQTSTAGALAAVNYGGYLLGALLCLHRAVNARRVWLFRASLLLSVGTTAAMGLSGVMAVWWVARFLAGVASAGVMVLGSALALDSLAQRGAGGWRGLIFSGIGVGIAVSGLMIRTFDGLLTASELWLMLALLCVPLAAASWRWLDATTFPARQMAVEQAHSRLPPFLFWLTAAYGCVGMGYIVSGTFVVAIIEANAASSDVGITTWIVVGLAAAGSTMLWPVVAARVGEIRALVAAIGLQAIGIVLPALSPGVVAAYAGALLFGGTFMGIVTLTMSLGQRLAPQQSTRVLGLLTAAYGTGQIIGPLPAGVLAEQTASFTLPLIGAAGVVTAGGVLLIIGARQKQGYQPYDLKGKADAIR